MTDDRPLDPERAGYEAFFARRRCAVLEGHAPAANLSGAEAIRWYFPAEKQGAVQFQQPAAPWRLAWVAGWDRARADAKAGKVEVCDG